MHDWNKLYNLSTICLSFSLIRRTMTELNIICAGNKTANESQFFFLLLLMTINNMFWSLSHHCAFDQLYPFVYWIKIDNHIYTESMTFVIFSPHKNDMHLLRKNLEIYFFRLLIRIIFNHFIMSGSFGRKVPIV
jgi:hypothetical protein